MTVVQERMEFLKKLDTIIRYINDEEFHDVWFTYFPDGADKYDLEYIASDDEMFNETCSIFSRCISSAYKVQPKDNDGYKNIFFVGHLDDDELEEKRINSSRRQRLSFNSRRGR